MARKKQPALVVPETDETVEQIQARMDEHEKLRNAVSDELDKAREVADEVNARLSVLLDEHRVMMQQMLNALRKERGNA